MNYSGLIRYLKRFRQPAKKQKVYIFLLCLLCSAIFWLSIKLSRETQAIFRQSLALHDIPLEKVLFAQSDSVVTFSLQTTGARLIRSRFSSSRDSVHISIASLPALNREGLSYHYATANMLSGILDEQLEVNFTVSSVRPDTLFFHVVQGLEKKVPVQLHADLSYERRFGLYGEISLQPDSLTIYGPDNLVDSIHYVSTELLTYHSLDQSVKVMARFDYTEIHPTIRVYPETVEVEISVEEYTEAHVEVPLLVQCNDATDHFTADKLRLFPNRVNIVFLVALRDYHRVQAELFSAYVDCPEKLTTDQQLKVKAGLLPDFVRAESVRPARVDYLIMK